ncbi:MAG: tetratricopeptide repeat protein, partial [Saprospiraceae bacterium]|nr:tetratricopeptide repeat protein [Saprospiraceae bacterium]
MKNKDIESLKEALQNSPDNLPLRIMLGDKYFHLNQIEEAESEYQVVLEYDKNNIRAKEGL